MIPYFRIPTYKIDDFIIFDIFGALVLTAILVGFFTAKRRARRVGLDPEEAHDMMIWLILGGFTISHIVAMVFDFPERLLANPWEILYIWSPISSLGGFLGALITAWIYCRYRKIPMMAYCDAIVYGFVAAWVFGRLGCTCAHDHPGALTDFFLAVEYPRGVRHDLGFYEFLFTLLVIFPVTRVLGRKPRPDGFFMVLIPIIYMPIRFVMDFLRATDYGNVDIRYLGLTIAQWLSLLLLALAIPLLIKTIRHGHTREWIPYEPPQKEPQPEAGEAQ